MNSDDKKRFFGHVKVNLTNGCWEWTKSKNSDGYGQFVVCRNGQASNISAHRVSYSIHYGSIPKGMNVCHKCDNRICTNPDHLFLGTHQDNMDDKVSKGRQAKGVGAGRGKLSAFEVKKIRELYDTGDYTQIQLGSRFGISRGMVYRIVNRKSWTNLDETPDSGFSSPFKP